MKDYIDLEAETLETLWVVAEKIKKFAGDQKVFLVKGPMGAGKTTLIKSICGSLGSSDNFSSPTYALVNEYKSPEGRICHFDLYRLRNIEELYDLGIQEYLASGSFCFFEWPELLEEAFSLHYLEILISVKENNRYFRVRHRSTE